MSLDVYLTTQEKRVVNPTSGIFIRSNGETKEISRAEWDELNPNQEPVMIKEMLEVETHEVYSRNITHNLGAMAQEAGIYKQLWWPEEVGAKIAKDLIGPLAVGLSKLKAAPEIFKKHNPDNGWGNYDGLVSFVEDYLSACEEYPEATIGVCR